MKNPGHWKIATYSAHCSGAPQAYLKNAGIHLAAERAVDQCCVEVNWRRRRAAWRRQGRLAQEQAVVQSGGELDRIAAADHVHIEYGRRHEPMTSA
jgi:hypothetical protein